MEAAAVKVLSRWERRKRPCAHLFVGRHIFPCFCVEFCIELDLLHVRQALGHPGHFICFLGDLDAQAGVILYQDYRCVPPHPA